MATRSVIGQVQADGTILAIYCHWGGFLEEAGAILHAHYQDPSKVAALIALGYLSELGPELGEQHDVRTHGDAHPDWCLAYGRDRGDKGVAAWPLADVNAFLTYAASRANGYAYLFDDGEWYVYLEREGNTRYRLGYAVERKA